MREKIKEIYKNVMDILSVFLSFYVIVGLVWCLTPNMNAFVIALIAIAMGTVSFIDLLYIFCAILKRIKEKLKISDRSEKEKDKPIR